MAREIILDTETTGFDPKTGDRLVEIGCIEVVDYMPTGSSFHEYCDPLRDMPAEAEKVHGLSAAFLTGKPKFHEIAEAPALDKKFTHDIDVVVDRIVVLMGGEMGMDSAPGKGSRFWVSTPLPRSAQRPAATTASGTASSPGQFEGRRVLLVEDDESNA
jgi:hypothetical protein